MFINLETRINLETSILTWKHNNQVGNIKNNFETALLKFMFQQ